MTLIQTQEVLYELVIDVSVVTQNVLIGKRKVT